MAEGIKWKNGQLTGEPALLVLVTHKQEKGEISPANLVPGKLGDMQTDVLAVGHVFAGGCEPDRRWHSGDRQAYPHGAGWL